MTNSDYLIKATLKKISERVNKTFIEKIEEASNAAQEVPDILKKELENLKKEIIDEAQRMEKEVMGNDTFNQSNKSNNPTINKTLKKIESINNKLEILNQLIDK